MGLEDFREQGREVEPFLGRALQGAVVEIESVHIDAGAHCCRRKKAGASEETPRLAVETARGADANLGFRTPEVKPLPPPHVQPESGSRRTGKLEELVARHG